MKKKALTLAYLISELRKAVEDRKSDRVKAIELLKNFMDEQRLLTRPQRDLVTKRVVDEEKLRKMIDWFPHENQQNILNSPAKIKVIAAGRGFGKSVLCAYVALKNLLEDNKKIAIIAPTYDLTGRIREYLNIWINKCFRKEIRIHNRPLPRYISRWGSYIDCLSAEKPEIILGKGYDVIIIDEAPLIDEKVHNLYIATASREKEGELYYIGTPRGQNYFYKLWLKQKEVNSSFRFTSIDNPYFPKSVFEEKRKRLAEMVFKQEYESVFLEEAVVFVGLDRCLRKDLTFQEYNPKHLYQIGIDFGKLETFTAISVIDLMTHQLVYYDQWKEPDWSIIEKRIISILENYQKNLAWVDATSITAGDVYVDQLVKQGYDVRGYKIHGIAKRQLIENLMVKIQNGQILIPDIPETEPLIEQLRVFTFTITPTGHISYHAPAGMYDDGVISLALACWEIGEEPLEELKEGKTEIIKFPIAEY